MVHDRQVAGIRCLQVLELLPDFLDESLTASQRALLEAHLAGCDWCAEFGGRYAGTVRELRQHLGDPAPLPSDVAERLTAALADIKHDDL